MVGEIADDALVLGGGVIRVSLFAVTFAEAEDGGGGEFAVLIVLGDDGLVGLDGGVEVMVGFFFEERLLEGGAEIGGSGGEFDVREQEQGGEERNKKIR